MSESWLGRRIRVEVQAVAHGGHCVARHEGRVVFVRHALPDETVTAFVTEDTGGAFCRADAIEVHTASPDRVSAPCPYAGPGRCGGCDWQHVTGERQRRLKMDVVREQLHRLGGVSEEDLSRLGLGPDAAAEELDGGLLGWRTRVRFAVSPEGIVGLRAHRSHDLIPVQRCLIASDRVTDLELTARGWVGLSAVTGVVSSAGDDAVVLTGSGSVEVDLPEHVAVLAASDRGPARAVHGHARVREDAAGRRWMVHADGFWQVHPAAPDVLVAAVLAGLAPQPGERALDLYCGVGLFAGALAERVGPAGSVTAVESDSAAATDARRNLRGLDQVRVTRGRVEQVIAKQHRDIDVVVLDPPRSGAGGKVVRAIAGMSPRAIAYVACDPAALGRDVKTFTEVGYRLSSVRVFDAFPMTHHTECVALLHRA